MLKFKTSEFVPTAEAELAWVFIDGEGKADLNGKMRYVASLKVKSDTDGCKALKEAISTFWKENKPKGGKLKSSGYRTEMENDGEKTDDNGDQLKKETGFTMFNFWTGTAFQDGNKRKIDIYNSKGNKVSLQGKKIGNGSKGAISGTMAIYDNGPSAQGVTLYLNAVQLTKFVEFSGDAGFGEEDGEFDGVDSEFDEVTSAEETTEASPRL